MLKAMPAAEVVAVNQCSGNRRGLFQPHVPGVEWGYGAMGCARWKGARLKDVLDKVGLKKEAIEIVFGGADGPPFDKTPDFIKSIPVWKAIEDTTLIAYEMNGAPLPHLNGAPARIIVPGWTGTYWMKHINSIKAVTKPDNEFLDEPGLSHSARQVPDRGALHLAGDRGQHADHRDGGELADHQPRRRRQGAAPAPRSAASPGTAATASARSRCRPTAARPGPTATLGEDLGKYAFRTWSFPLTGKGKVTVMARASNAIGQTQTATLIHNPAGYHHNVIHSVTLNVA